MPLTLTPAQCARAASAYRALIRAQRLTFKGDEYALKAAYQQTRILFNRFVPSASTSLSPFNSSAQRSAFELKPSEDLTSESVDQQIDGAFEVATFFRRNVVQGAKNDEGNFVLRIHDETERGDNDTIKQKKVPEIPADNLKVRRRRRRNQGAA
ncbi:hypothetical protein Rhopal_001529-T1 [Rhodotorula paludigena]|uniref:Mitochondrial zinc maintenance protein 1, mitochondrial n=1 Tax=Rhodotorula paludigena TaxID=86838 RepID=A0AAV5GE56_9BASI|nr:hypothetical protein Rhopal_001529-T1 [Rhodotorula paludigena]